METLTLICYKRCSTCAKARKKLQELNIDYVERDVQLDCPDKKTILQLLNRMEKPRQLFNTSGKVYREQGLAKKINFLSLDEMADLLASNGMLLKRPILFNEEILIVGYQEDAYEVLAK